MFVNTSKIDVCSHFLINLISVPLSRAFSIFPTDVYEIRVHLCFRPSCHILFLSWEKFFWPTFHSPLSLPLFLPLSPSVCPLSFNFSWTIRKMKAKIRTPKLYCILCFCHLFSFLARFNRLWPVPFLRWKIWDRIWCVKIRFIHLKFLMKWVALHLSPV